MRDTIEAQTSTRTREMFGLRAVLASTVSDSHTWNLVFLQLLLKEHGYQVRNLGACVPPELLAQRCAAWPPDLVVLSSVNGHGIYDGIGAVSALRAVPELLATPVVIGGKLGIDHADPEQGITLLNAGIDSVFGEGAAELARFRAYLGEVAVGAVRVPASA
jgi:methylaspartate mutase sigma subunit